MSKKSNYSILLFTYTFNWRLALGNVVNGSFKQYWRPPSILRFKYSKSGIPSVSILNLEEFQFVDLINSNAIYISSIIANSDDKKSQNHSYKSYISWSLGDSSWNNAKNLSVRKSHWRVVKNCNTSNPSKIRFCTRTMLFN